MVCIALYTSSIGTPSVSALSRSTFTSSCWDDALNVEVTRASSGRFFAFARKSFTTPASCGMVASPLL